tara:strand:+ start:22393 stop:22599 length:207 start_codon:yes stop_codon:yes gene_type:complete
MTTTVLKESQSLGNFTAVLTQVADQAKFVMTRARSRRQMAALDSRMLADVGLTRKDAITESRKIFWQA